jgi:hypothetical protein
MTPESHAEGDTVTGPSPRPFTQPYGDVRGRESASEVPRTTAARRQDRDARGEPPRSARGHLVEPHHAATRLRTDEEQAVLIAYLARAAELRSQGCTCTPSCLMGGEAIYAQDVMCPVHRTGTTERGAA